MIKSALNPENVSVQYLSVYCTLTLHHVIECTPKRSELSVQYRTHRCYKEIAADVGMLSSEAMIFIEYK